MPATRCFAGTRALILTLAAAAGPLAAQTVKDPQLAALLDGGKVVEVERIASSRVAARPDDLDAHAALTLAVLSPQNAARREAAMQRLEDCVARLPAAAVCHFGVGTVLGAQVLSQGMLKALGSAGRIRDALARAVELDPTLYAARNALVQYYLMAPGFLGGSESKAVETAQAAAPRQPEHAKLMLAMVALHRKQFDQVDRALAAIRPGDDRELAADTAELRAELGIVYLNERQPEKARAALEKAVQERPQSALAQFGLGRALTEAGSFEPAIAAFDRAGRLDGGSELPIDYRLALAHLGLGDKDRARALLTRFVAAGRGSSKSLDDARKRLAELG
jgi:tetratricopeptide (TPR) repeat protein